MGLYDTLGAGILERPDLLPTVDGHVLTARWRLPIADKQELLDKPAPDHKEAGGLEGLEKPRLGRWELVEYLLILR